MALGVVISTYMLSRFSHVGLCEPMNSSPAGPSVHGILQARILEWVAISFSSLFYNMLLIKWVYQNS